MYKYLWAIPPLFALVLIVAGCHGGGECNV